MPRSTSHSPEGDLLLAIPLTYDPALPLGLRKANQALLVVLMEASFEHLVHGNVPELILDEFLNAQLCVTDLTERIRCQLPIFRRVEYLGDSGKWHWTLLHLDELLHLRPEQLVAVAANYMREVELLVKAAFAEDVLRLLVPVRVVEANVEEDKIA